MKGWQSIFFVKSWCIYGTCGWFHPAQQISVPWWHRLLPHLNTAAVKSLRAILVLRHVSGTRVLSSIRFVAFDLKSRLCCITKIPLQKIRQHFKSWCSTRWGLMKFPICFAVHPSIVSRSVPFGRCHFLKYINYGFSAQLKLNHHHWGNVRV